ncbi:ribonuclease III domain-containing protein [Dipodascopsis uninucleata]
MAKRSRKPEEDMSAKRKKTPLISVDDAEASSDKIVRRVDVFLEALNKLLQDTPEFFDVNDSSYVTDPRVDLALALRRLLKAGGLNWAQIKDFKKYSSILNTEQKNSDDEWEHRIPTLQPLRTVGMLIDKMDNDNSRDWPPVLPEIKNEVILKRVFQHKSLANELNKTQEHYERLEFLGDSFINHIMSKLVYLSLPRAQEGELTKIRTELVNNSTLHTWGSLYGFDKRIEVSQSAEKSTNIREAIKSTADVFEAYVAGLLHDSDEGSYIAENWLFKLAEPTIKKARSNILSPSLIDRNAKNRLYDLIGHSKQKPEYVTLAGNENIGYTVSCQIDGEELSRGWANNIKDAGLRAASIALDSPTVIAKYRRKKVTQFCNEDN